jgi:hypothetical protein
MPSTQLGLSLFMHVVNLTFLKFNLVFLASSRFPAAAKNDTNLISRYLIPESQPNHQFEGLFYYLNWTPDSLVEENNKTRCPECEMWVQAMRQQKSRTRRPDIPHPHCQH